VRVAGAGAPLVVGSNPIPVGIGGFTKIRDVVVTLAAAQPLRGARLRDNPIPTWTTPARFPSPSPAALASGPGAVVPVSVWWRDDSLPARC